MLKSIFGRKEEEEKVKQMGRLPPGQRAAPVGVDVGAREGRRGADPDQGGGQADGGQCAAQVLLASEHMRRPRSAALLPLPTSC